MTQPYIGQIMIFGFNFAPRDYAFTNGQLMAISQNAALFSILGTTYGGNGQTTFALPNIQNNGVLNIGQGPGLQNYSLGETLGTDTITLNINQIPVHTHQVYAHVGTSEDPGPTNSGWFGKSAPPGRVFSDQAVGDKALSLLAMTNSGGNLPHQNQQPYLGMNFCIALFGIFPSRN